MAAQPQSKVVSSNFSKLVYDQVHRGLCQLEQQGSEKSQMIMMSLFKNAPSLGRGNQKTHFSDQDWKLLERFGLVGNDAPNTQIMYSIVQKCLVRDETSGNVHVVNDKK